MCKLYYIHNHARCLLKGKKQNKAKPTLPLPISSLERSVLSLAALNHFCAPRGKALAEGLRPQTAPLLCPLPSSLCPFSLFLSFPALSLLPLKFGNLGPQKRRSMTRNKWGLGSGKLLIVK